MAILQRRTKAALEYLNWKDVLILTIILFSSFIFNSLSQSLNPEAFNHANVPMAAEFTSDFNWRMMGFQSVLLVVAFLYLYLRHFKFSQWTVRINAKSILLGVLLFIGISLLFDLYYGVVYHLFPQLNVDAASASDITEGNPILEKMAEIDISLILYSLLNGCYEEIFFLGICLSVAPEKRFFYFMYSLLVRYSFHTYQGTVSALAIGVLLGTAYYVLYTRMKDKNLFPFFLSHAIMDILGIGLINYFM